MKLVVLGASGGCGRWVVRLAAERGHEVIAVVRPEKRFDVPDTVTVQRGHVTDPTFLSDVLRDGATILSCLGLRRANLTPFAKLLSPPDLVQRVMATLVEVVASHDGVRVIWISAGGVGSSRAALGWPVRGLVDTGNIGVAYRDLDAAERIVSTSHLSSHAVRPVTLVNGRPTGRAGPVERYGLWSMVRRSDVAHWMLDVAEGTRVGGETVLLGYR